MSILADDLRGGGRFVKWADLGPGVVITGTIARVEKRQCLNFDDKKPEFWADGKPKEEALIHIATDQRSDPDDDGERVIVINLWGQQRKSLAEAVRKVGRAEPLVGDTFAAVWTSGAGGSRDPRQFAYQVTPGAGLGLTEPVEAAADPFAAAAREADAIAAASAPATPATLAAAPQAAADPMAGLSPEVLAAIKALTGA